MNFHIQTNGLHSPFHCLIQLYAPLHIKYLIRHSNFNIVISILFSFCNKCSGFYYNFGLCLPLFLKDWGSAEWMSTFFMYMRLDLGNIFDILGAHTWELQKGICFPDN